MQTRRTSNDVGDVLAGLRLFVGTASWLTPRLTSMFSALGSDLDPRQRYLWRIFGIRDAALATGFLASKSGDRRLWIKAALVSDFSDGTASIISGRKAGLSLPMQLLHSAPGVIGTTMGLVALAHEGKRKRRFF